MNSGDKQYAIINSTAITFISADDMEGAKETALRFCDCSEEIIIREVKEVYLRTPLQINN